MKTQAVDRASLLLVDDEPNISEALAETFRGEFASIHRARSGKEALNILRQRPIDVIVTDIRMPELDGMQLLNTVRSEFPSIPVIVVTSFGEDRVSRQVLEAGAFDYLEKPFSLDLLIKRVRNAYMQKLLYEVLRAGLKGKIQSEQLESFFRADSQEQIRLLTSYASILKLQAG